MLHCPVTIIGATIMAIYSPRARIVLFAKSHGSSPVIGADRIPHPVELVARRDRAGISRDLDRTQSRGLCFNCLRIESATNSALTPPRHP